MEKLHKKKSRIRKRLLLVLDGALVVGAITAIIVLIVTRVSGGSAAATPAASNAAESSESTQASGSAGNSAVSAESMAYFSWGSAGEAPLSIDFDMLASAGVSAAGWLYCEGTSINSPVVQYKDNEYYMTHNAFGKKDKAGAIYLDCRNSASLQDEQVFLYGNPMADGSMFGGLVQYRDQGFFDAHPSMYFLAPSGNYRIDVYAVHTASPEMSNNPIWFENASARSAYIRNQQANSLITPSTEVGEGTLISLVTCSDYDAGDDARLVINGVLTPLS